MNFSSRKTILIIALSALTAPALFLAALTTANSGNIAYGIKINSISMGGLPAAQAEKVLRQNIQEFSQKEITIVLNGQQLLYTPEAMGALFDIDATTRETVNFGHQKNFFTAISEQLTALISGKNIPIVFSLDQEKSQKFLDDIAAIADQPARDADFAYDQQKNELTITPEKNGAVLNRAVLLKRITDNFAALNASSISPPIENQSAKVTGQDLSAVKEKALAIIDNAPYYLQTQNSRWPLNKQQLTEWIDALPSKENTAILTVALNQDKLKDFLLQLAPSINQDPVNAQLTWNDGKVTAFSLAQDGLKLNISASIERINEGIINNQKNIELAYTIIKPAISTENMDMLGFTSLIGRGESNFVGSTKNRVHNIAVGAAKFNGLIIEPGAEFSFNENVGAIDAQSGYQIGLVLKNGKTLPEYGGGICQVSTTLFRAAINSGFKITKRYPHAIALHYYDPPGFDATIYPPNPDLRFVNDTPNKILLQSKIVGTKLIFEIYGTPDGREVKVIGPKTLESNPDGSKKTILTQEIWRDGALERSDIFRSSYKSPDLYPMAAATTGN